MKLCNLKLVDAYPFYKKEVDFASEGDAHSLHSLIHYPETSDANIINNLIKEYSQTGDVVFDPFCGSGSVAFESAILGRVPFACDANPIAKIITEAKLQPADLTEVTLKLQLANLRRPLNLDHYNEYFSPFYEVNTFRELLNLRQFVNREADRINNHLKALAMSLLHGPSGSYFSAGSPAQMALSPKEQSEYNQRRRQEPDYRGVIPRLIKRSALVLRDGVPSVLLRCSSKRNVFTSDARSLPQILTSHVDLILTAPPLPNIAEPASMLWLENWFAEISTQDIKQKLHTSYDLNDWLDFMNECLLEWARVTRVSGRCALMLTQLEAEPLLKMVESNLSKYWEADSLLIAKSKTNVIKKSNNEKRNHFLVFRRK